MAFLLIVCSVVNKTAYLVTVTNQHSIKYTSQVKQKPHCIGIATMHELLVLVNSLLGQFRLNIYTTKSAIKVLCKQSQ